MNITLLNQTNYEFNNNEDLFNPELIFYLIIGSNLIAILWNKLLDLKILYNLIKLEKVPREFETTIDEDTFTRCKSYQLDCLLYFEPFYIVFILLFYLVEIKYLLPYIWNISDFKNSGLFYSLIFLNKFLLIHFLIAELPGCLYRALVISKKFGLNSPTIFHCLSDQIIPFLLNLILDLIWFTFLFTASCLDKYPIFISFFIVLLLTSELPDCFIINLISKLFLKLHGFKLEQLPEQSKIKLKIEKLAESIDCPLKNISNAILTYKKVGLFYNQLKQIDLFYPLLNGILNKTLFIQFAVIDESVLEDIEVDKSVLEDIEVDKSVLEDIKVDKSVLEDIEVDKSDENKKANSDYCNEDEVLALVAMEFGSWKLNHNLKLRAFKYFLILFYTLLFSLFYLNDNFFKAFGFYKEKPICISFILCFCFINHPILLLERFLGGSLRRNLEFEINQFAKKTINIKDLKMALIKLERILMHKLTGLRKFRNLANISLLLKRLEELDEKGNEIV